MSEAFDRIGVGVCERRPRGSSPHSGVAFLEGQEQVAWGERGSGNLLDRHSWRGDQAPPGCDCRERQCGLDDPEDVADAFTSTAAELRNRIAVDLTGPLR